MLDFLDNSVVQATGHVAQAYAELTLRRDFQTGYKEFVTALALLKTSDIVPKVMKDIEARTAQLKAAREVDGIKVKGGQ